MIKTLELCLYIEELFTKNRNQYENIRLEHANILLRFQEYLLEVLCPGLTCINHLEKCLAHYPKYLLNLIYPWG